VGPEVGGPNRKEGTLGKKSYAAGQKSHNKTKEGQFKWAGGGGRGGTFTLKDRGLKRSGNGNLVKLGTVAWGDRGGKGEKKSKRVRGNCGREAGLQGPFGRKCVGKKLVRERRAHSP